VLDIERTKFIELISIVLDITYDTLDKANSEAIDVKILEKKIALLEN